MSDNVKIEVSVEDIIRTMADPRLGSLDEIGTHQAIIAFRHPGKAVDVRCRVANNNKKLDINKVREFAATALWEMLASNRKGDDGSPAPAPAPATPTWDIGYLHPVREPATNGRLIIKLADMPGSRKRWAVWSAEDGVGYMWTEGKTFTPAGDKKAKAIKMQYLRSMHMDDEGIAQLLDDEKLEAVWQG